MNNHHLAAIRVHWNPPFSPGWKTGDWSNNGPLAAKLTLYSKPDGQRALHIAVDDPEDRSPILTQVLNFTATDDEIDTIADDACRKAIDQALGFYSEKMAIRADQPDEVQE